MPNYPSTFSKQYSDYPAQEPTEPQPTSQPVQPEPKKSHLLRNIVLGLVALVVLGIIVLVVLFVFAPSTKLPAKPIENAASITTVELTERYSNFGFSFKYPAGMELEEQPWLGLSANNDSGILFGEYYPNEVVYNIVKMGWINTPPATDKKDEEDLLQTGLDAGFDFFDTLAKSAKNATKKERGEMNVNGTRAIYQQYQLEFEDRTLYGVIGSWYCNNTQKSFSFNVAYSKKEVLPLVEEYMKSFFC